MGAASVARNWSRLALARRLAGDTAHLEQLRLRTEAKGFALNQRLPVYPEFVAALTARPGFLSGRLRSAADGDGLAKIKRAA